MRLDGYLRTDDQAKQTPRNPNMDTNRIKAIEHALACAEVDLYNAKYVRPYDEREIEQLERRLNNLVYLLEDALAAS